MKVIYNDRPVEIELDSNMDGSRFISTAGYIDGKQEDLTDNEICELEKIFDDEINGHHWT
jgi:hypothetical protein